MKRLVAILAALCVGLTALAQEEDPWARIVAGDRLPAFEVTLTDGTTLSSQQLEGKVVWIALWASWCPSCRKEFKRLEANKEFAELFENEDFIFLPIAREENIATVAAWLRKKGYAWPSGVDPTREIYALFAEQEIPRNIIVGRDGVVVLHRTTYSKGDLGEIIEKAKEMLN